MTYYMERITLIICAVILFSTCASYAQSQMADPGYWDITSGTSGNILQGDQLTGTSNLSDGVADNSWGAPIPAEISEPSEGAYFPESISESKSALVDESTSSQYNQAIAVNDSSAFLAATGQIPYSPYIGPSTNIFWIVSKDGTMHWRAVNIPCHRYARLLMIPAYSGQLVMEERYPNGQVLSYNFGYVQAYKKYRAWFFADTPGIHLLRYRINNGQYTDILTLHVGNCETRICPCCGQIIHN
jgi:hypothetical protein